MLVWEAWGSSYIPLDLCSSKEIDRRPEGEENEIGYYVEKKRLKTKRELEIPFKSIANLIPVLLNNPLAIKQEKLYSALDCKSNTVIWSKAQTAKSLTA